MKPVTKASALEELGLLVRDLLTRKASRRAILSTVEEALQAGPFGEEPA